MACFLVPGSEAVVTTLLQKVVGKEKAEKWKLNWLNTMLWGGFILLAIEHVWHGEVVPWPPFLTAMKNPADTAAMLHEMATAGLAMAIVVTITWAIMVLVASILPKKIAGEATA
ncbi:MAG: hypothetical protein J7J36_00765 [Thermoplasmata archaeon]|nr:hypothetical protein [Thermoplasmata archaeon]